VQRGFLGFPSAAGAGCFSFAFLADLLLLDGLGIAFPTLILRDLVLGFFKGRWLFTLAVVCHFWSWSALAFRTN